MHFLVFSVCAYSFCFKNDIPEEAYKFYVEDTVNNKNYSVYESYYYDGIPSNQVVRFILEPSGKCQYGVVLIPDLNKYDSNDCIEITDHIIPNDCLKWFAKFYPYGDSLSYSTSLDPNNILPSIAKGPIAENKYFEMNVYYTKNNYDYQCSNAYVTTITSTHNYNQFTNINDSELEYVCRKTTQKHENCFDFRQVSESINIICEAGARVVKVFDEIKGIYGNIRYDVQRYLSDQPFKSKITFETSKDHTKFEYSSSETTGKVECIVFTDQIIQDQIDKENSENKKYMIISLVCGIGGAVIVIAIIVTVVCVIKKKKKKAVQ